MDLQEQYDRLLRYCCMKTGDRTLAEDIVQESFLKFFESKTYKHEGKEMAYLYTIARNGCADAFRRKRVFPMSDEEMEQRMDASGTDDTAQFIDRLGIEQALSKLPDDLREIVVLRYTSRLSDAQAGKVLGLTRFSVRRKAAQAIRLLRKEMEGDQA